MNLRQFIEYCEGNIEAVEKAIKIICDKDDLDFEDFAESSTYVDYEWEMNRPAFG